MEDTLRGNLEFGAIVHEEKVLILVLMEDTLRDHLLVLVAIGLGVLILVLMEDTLRVSLWHCV